MLAANAVVGFIIAHRVPNVRAVINPPPTKRVERWRPLRRVPLDGA